VNVEVAEVRWSEWPILKTPEDANPSVGTHEAEGGHFELLFFHVHSSLTVENSSYTHIYVFPLRMALGITFRIYDLEMCNVLHYTNFHIGDYGLNKQVRKWKNKINFLSLDK
jgi:hypothetical protein